MTDDKPDSDAEVFTIRWETIENVLWSEDVFDGTHFGEDKDGVTVVYFYDSMWALNLLLLTLAKVMGWILETDPPPSEFEQLYHTLADLTAGMSMPTPAPEFGVNCFSCKLPSIRIVGHSGAQLMSDRPA